MTRREKFNLKIGEWFFYCEGRRISNEHLANDLSAYLPSRGIQLAIFLVNVEGKIAGILSSALSPFFDYDLYHKNVTWFPF